MERYPYLVCSLLLLGALAVLWAVARPRQRRLILWSGLLSAPLASGACFFVPEYWQPMRVLGTTVGVEDILFSFAMGGLTWVAATGLTADRIRVPPHPLRAGRRYAVVLSLGALSLLGLWSAGLGAMSAVLYAAAATVLLLLALRPALWRVALAGAAVLALTYTVACSLWFVLWPSFLDQWNADALSGARLLGVPAEEILWSLAHGAAWSLVMCLVFDVRLRRRTSVPVVGRTAPREARGLEA